MNGDIKNPKPYKTTGDGAKSRFVKVALSNKDLFEKAPYFTKMCEVQLKEFGEDVIHDCFERGPQFTHQAKMCASDNLKAKAHADKQYCKIEKIKHHFQAALGVIYVEREGRTKVTDLDRDILCFEPVACELPILHVINKKTSSKTNNLRVEGNKVFVEVCLTSKGAQEIILNALQHLIAMAIKQHEANACKKASSSRSNKVAPLSGGKKE